MKKDIHIEVTNKIVEQLAQGVRPWTKPWTVSNGITITGGGTSLPLRSNGKPYSGINVLLLWSTGYQPGTRWLTYRQALALGGQVRRGEKGTGVVFFKPLKVANRDDATKTKTIPLLRSYTVFNVAQIDGLPPRLHPTPAPVPTTPEETKAAEITRDERVEAYLANVPAKVRYYGDRAFYNPTSDAITLPPREQFTSADGYYDTHLHELGHWTGHKSRLDRTFGASYSSAGYAREELVAELTSAFLCAALGVNRGELREDHASYLSAWLSVLQEDSSAIFKAAAQAQRAVDHLNSYQPKVADDDEETEEDEDEPVADERKAA